jgi:hypothetical protein
MFAGDWSGLFRFWVRLAGNAFAMVVMMLAGGS